MKNHHSNVPLSSKFSIPDSPEAAPVISLHSWAIAPALAALATGLQLVMGAWKVCLQQPLQSGELQSLTNTVKIVYRPDYDMLIYVLGTAFTLALTLTVGILWHRRLSTIQGEDRLAWICFLLFTHIPAAGAIAILPLSWSTSPCLSFMFGCLGLLFCCATFWASGREPLALPRWLLWPKAFRCIEAVLVVSFVVLVVYIPDTARVSSLIYQHDRYHHWDFYMMAPALAYRHGMALGTDFFTQYGVGWPFVLAWFSQFTPLSYKLGIQIGVVWGCIYFSALFFFLRMLLKSTTWALAGVLIALSCQLFCGTNLPKWVFPSSTVLRYSADIFLFAALFAYARNGKAWLGLPTGLFAALCLIFATDVGIFILISLGLYFLAVQRVRPDNSLPRQTWGFILGTALTYVVVLLTGLAIASRGTLTRPEFWSRWTESLRLYSSGHGHLPIREVCVERSAYVMLIFMLFCYLFAIYRMLEGLYRKKLAPGKLIIGMVALYGLGTLTWFIGRSHPWNMHHVSVPFCIVLTGYFADLHAAASQAVEQSNPSRPFSLLKISLALVPSVCACFALIALLINPRFRLYPNLPHRVAQERSYEPEVPADNYLFASRKDTPLPVQFNPTIANFRDVTKRMQELADNGRKTVAIFDYADTHFLVESDLRPYFRYSPLVASLFFRKQVRFVQQQILENPPDYILFPREPQPDIHNPSYYLLFPPEPRTDIHVNLTSDVHESLLKTIKKQYIISERINDIDVYLRKP